LPRKISILLFIAVSPGAKINITRTAQSDVLTTQRSAARAVVLARRVSALFSLVSVTRGLPTLQKIRLHAPNWRARV
jgi:hypothetical protein